MACEISTATTRPTQGPGPNQSKFPHPSTGAATLPPDNTTLSTGYPLVHPHPRQVDGPPPLAHRPDHRRGPIRGSSGETYGKALSAELVADEGRLLGSAQGLLVAVAEVIELT